MPPGPKKRKANKKKKEKEKEKEKEKTDPNPNSDPSLLHHQGNGRENHGSTDEEPDEAFEASKSHPDATAVDPQLENGFGGIKAADVVGSVETEENLAVEEESTPNHQPRVENLEAGEDLVPEASIESIDAYATREKEAKIVPLVDDQEFAVNVEEEKARIDVDEGLGDAVLERSLKENSDVTEGFNVDYDEMKVYSLKATNSDGVAEESLVGDKVLVKEVDTRFNEDEANEPFRVDEDLKETQLDTLSKEKYMLSERPIFVNEEVSQHSKATAQNLNKVLVGVVDTPTPEKGAKDIVLQDPARIEIAPKTEVVRSHLVVRRATLWNCCGLLDVVTESWG